MPGTTVENSFRKVVQMHVRTTIWLPLESQREKVSKRILSRIFGLNPARRVIDLSREAISDNRQNHSEFSRSGTIMGVLSSLSVEWLSGDLWHFLSRVLKINSSDLDCLLAECHWQVVGAIMAASGDSSMENNGSGGYFFWRRLRSSFPSHLKDYFPIQLIRIYSW